MPALTPRVERIAVLLLLALFVGLAAGSVHRSSVTADEYAHLPAGCAYLRRGALDLYAKNPPLVRYVLALPALLGGAAVPVPEMRSGGAGWDPWIYGDAFVEANAGPRGLGRYPRLLGLARAAAIVLSVGLLLLVHRWSRRAHGPEGALLSLGLGALSPTLLAHGSLATVDAGAALAFTAAAYLCARALAEPSVGRWGAAGAAVGIALASKFTALLLLPLVLLWGAVALARTPAAQRSLRRIASQAGAFLLAAFVVLHVAYQLDRPVRTLGAHRFASAAGRAVAAWLPAWTPVPLPAAMVAGLDGQALDLEQAEMPSYLDGRWSRQGWWYYYPVALALKTPLALPGLALLAAWLGWRGRGGGPAPPARRQLRWIGGSAAAAVLLASMGTRLDIGVRYLLPMLPFVWLLLGGLAPAAARAGRSARIVLAALLVAYAGASLAAYPHYLAFFNRLGGGISGGDRYLLNSNNDWGQDLLRLKDWLDARGIEEPISLAYFGSMDPARYGIDYHLTPDRPQPGLHAVSLNLLHGMPYVINDHGSWRLLGDLTRPQQRYAWLRERTPIAQIGGSIRIFRITDPAPPAP